ncbi:hypothetical protein VIGAN_01530400 [Vigna angularis var. angularis]|uniref:Uncharacterized protein n=1 Tax=Vigna angularis var. angularis TaxID=157739 RepID=A0A0S3R970_PHAAN|nr:hypothetical protein VIGAN_01530400 [Vigna angularis var. angularis]
MTIFVFQFLNPVVTSSGHCNSTNTVHWFYLTLLQVLPTVIGTVAGGLFMIFPDKRHGIGYPITSHSNDTPIRRTMPSQCIRTILLFIFSL